MSCIIADRIVSRDASGGAVAEPGRTVIVTPTYVPVFELIDEMRIMFDPKVSDVSDTDGAWSISLPWPSESDPDTVRFQITLPDGSAFVGVVPEGVAGPLTLHDLKQDHGWALVKTTLVAPLAIQGPPGPAGITWRGAYNGATAYAVRDAVSYGGASYYCTVAATGVLPTDSSHWALLAARGNDGVSQVQSPPGANIPARTVIAVDGTLLLAADDAANNRTVLSAPGLVPITRRIIAGPGLAGGGDMAGDPTLSMPAVGPGAGAIGGAGQAVSQLTLDAQGRVTAATAGPIGGTLSGLTAGKIPRATGASAVGNGSISDDGAGNISVVGKMTAGAMWSATYATQVSTIAAASAISPTTGIVVLTGNATVNTITPPFPGWTGCIRIIIGGGLVIFGSSGNIAAGSQYTTIPGKSYDAVYDGTSWYITGEQRAVVISLVPLLINGWLGSAGRAGYFVINGVLTLCGYVTSGTPLSTIAVLPYHPVSLSIFTCPTPTGAKEVRVNTDGSIVPQSNDVTYISLQDMSFPVA